MHADVKQLAFMQNLILFAVAFGTKSAFLHDFQNCIGNSIAASGNCAGVTVDSPAVILCNSNCIFKSQKKVVQNSCIKLVCNIWVGSTVVEVFNC